MNQDRLPTSAEDESLKQAIRSAWGNETAPSALRHRVQMAMTRTVLEEPEIPETTRSRRFWDRWPTPLRIAAAVAALILVAFGTTWGIMSVDEYQRAARRQAGSEPTHITPAPSPTLYAMLITRHDDFFAGADEEPPLSADQIVPTRDALSVQLNHPIWVPDLVKLGWKLNGIRVFTVNGVSAVSFGFSRGTDEISAISLPVQFADMCAGSIPDIDQIVDNRSISAFAQDGQLFALIGSRNSSPYPQADLRALSERFRADPACRPGCTTAPSTVP